MVLSKIVISAIAAAATAYAAECSSSSAITIQNQQDVNGVASCPKYDGDININTNAGASLDFGTIGEITGTVSMDSDDLLGSLKFSSLQTLGGLKLTNLTRLATLDLSSLTSVGDMTLENLAALSTFNFGLGLQEAGDIRIENVQISDLSGISSATKVDSVVLANCQYLSNITFTFTDVGTVDIGPNNYQQGQQISFPQLRTATSLFLRNSTAINTPKLQNVSETLGLYGNTFQSYSAANLSAVGALVLESNPQVTNFSFPNLVHINGDNATLDIENNTMLTSIDGFPKLIDVQNGGAIFAGNIKNISLKSLTNIAGALVVDTTDSSFDCNQIFDLGNKQIAKGNVSCVAGDSTPVGSSGSTTSSGSSGSSSHTNAAGAVELPTFLTTGAFAALLAFLA